MTDTSHPGPNRAGPESERRGFVAAAAVLFGVLAVLGVVVMFTVDDGGNRTSTQGQAQEEADPRADSIPRPGEGQAPDDTGERGGAVQLALAGGLFAVVLVGGALVVWSARRGSAGRGRGARSLSRRPRTNG